MSDTYRKILRSRNDMTEWLIHFTHKSFVKFDWVEAKENLFGIVSDGVIRAGWSLRGGRPTIYGPSPAVCFTEQPLFAFCQYLEARPDRECISGCGVLVHKHDAFAEGSNPVIYGLNLVNELSAGQAGYEPKKRVLSTTSLPYNEQYRYVAFAPNREGDPVDWTHEREWRWSHEQAEPAIGGFPLCGSLRSSTERGRSQGRVHVFVETESDIAWLKQRIAPFVANLGRPDKFVYRERWLSHLRDKVRVLSLERVRTEVRAGNRAFARLEGWPESELSTIS